MLNKRIPTLLALTAALAVAAACNDVSTNPAATSDAAMTAAVTPGGEMSVRVHNFGAILSGEDAGVDTRARGAARFRVGPDGMSMRFRLIVANLDDVTMAHIHVSETAGGNGPPAVWLYPDGPPPMLIEGTTSGVLAEGTITASSLVGPLDGMAVSDLVAAINEGRAYVNVHTDANPGGEIRGPVE